MEDVDLIESQYTMPGLYLILMIEENDILRNDILRN